MSDKGFIKMDRGLRDWQWYSKRNMVAIWIELLLTAAFSDYYRDGILVKRGQVITGRKKLSEKLNISEQEIRSCLDRLKSTNEITIKTTNKYSVITIVKYDEYQGKPEWTNQQINQENNQQVTNKQPASSQQITTIKECKEEKEFKSINTLAQSDLKNPSTPEAEPVITLTLQDNSEYAVVENQLKEWQELYPSIDVMQELRKMKGWLNANPTKRKTKRGIKKFINSWLARAFDRAPKGTKKELPKWFNDQDIVQMGDENVDDDELMKQLRALRGEKKA